MDVFITGSGVYTPEYKISNEELVQSFNQFVQSYNECHQEQINSGELKELAFSSEEFILKASGISSRYVIEKEGVLNPDIMHPLIEERKDDELSLQAEVAVDAAKKALINANKSAEEIDAVICACSSTQRPFPAMAIEVQKALGIKGFGYDMNVACSSATFAIANAKGLIDAGLANSVLIVTPEICSAQLNFRDRDSHFIFGDVATALVIENETQVKSDNAYKIIDIQLSTEFSSNVRNNAGFMNRLTPGCEGAKDKLFYQNGRKVFKEVTTEVVRLIRQQIENMHLSIDDFKRLWLHQANIHMNRLIVEKLTGRELSDKLAPVILNEYANTAGAGSIIAFSKYQQDLSSGDKVLLCSFGAGYSIGSIVLQRH